VFGADWITGEARQHLAAILARSRA
jgi:hypothetical protein